MSIECGKSYRTAAQRSRHKTVCSANRKRLCCTNPVWESSHESSVVAGIHEQPRPLDIQDQELARLQWSAQAPGLADDLVRSRDELGGRADRQAWPQHSYSDAAIQTCLSMKVLFGMVEIGAPLVRTTISTRQTTGFVESLLRPVGLDWTVPNFSTQSRRQKTLAANIPYHGSKGPLHLLIDSTGIKVEGECEWHARKHGGPKRRVWRKIHFGIDEETLEVRAVEITGRHIGPYRQTCSANRLSGNGCAGAT